MEIRHQSLHHQVSITENFLGCNERYDNYRLLSLAPKKVSLKDRQGTKIIVIIRI